MEGESLSVLYLVEIILTIITNKKPRERERQKKGLVADSTTLASCCPGCAASYCRSCVSNPKSRS
ncbi:hypothetical protein SCA6_013541 [Theobroma cacao]